MYIREQPGRQNKTPNRRFITKFSAKPWPEPMQTSCQMDLLIEFHIKTQNSDSRRCIWKILSAKWQPFSDIGKTFGPLPDRRTGNHMENPSFTGPPKLFIGPIFFYIRIPIEGLLTATFFTGQEDRHTKGFHWSSTVFTGRGPRTGGFPDVCILFRPQWVKVLDVSCVDLYVIGSDYFYHFSCHHMGTKSTGCKPINSLAPEKCENNGKNVIF